MTKEELKNNHVFCMMPWIHMHIWPNGNALPCCIADSNDVYGNVNNKTLKEVWNNDKFSTMRKKMLAGEEIETCSRCYELEKSTKIYTLRQSINFDMMDKHFDLVQSTKEDGTLENPRMAYMDIRFSNICNMKCRTCGPELSSTHAQEHADMWSPKHTSELMGVAEGRGPVISVTQDNPHVWEDLEQYLMDVEEVYFAGGEILITEEHYKLLDYWIENGKTDVRLRYTTNFSNFKFKKKSLFDYWKKFSDVNVAASIDTFGHRAEYMRWGTVWKTIEDNRRQMIQECPNIKFEITPTISIYNVYSWPDMHRRWYGRDLLNVADVRFNILTDPVFMRIDNVPPNQKEELIKLYQRYYNWLESLCPDDSQLQHYTSPASSVIDFLTKNDGDMSLLKEFFLFNHELDQYRKEDFWDAYPELHWLRSYVD